MKKLFTVMAIVSIGIINAQEIALTKDGRSVLLNDNGTYKYLSNEMTETILKDSDFTKTETDVVLNKEITILNGDDKPTFIKIQFNSTKDQYNLLTLQKLNEIIKDANENTKYNLKNKRTYIPKKLIIKWISEDKCWLLGFEYTAQNDYGATKDDVFISEYTDKGVFKKS